MISIKMNGQLPSILTMNVDRDLQKLSKSDPKKK